MQSRIAEAKGNLLRVVRCYSVCSGNCAVVRMSFRDALRIGVNTSTGRQIDGQEGKRRSWIREGYDPWESL